VSKPIAQWNELRITARVKNNRLTRLREETGRTLSQAGKEIGIGPSLLSAYECLRESPLSSDGLGWRSTAVKIAEFYGAACEDIWPEGMASVMLRAGGYSSTITLEKMREIEEQVAGGMDTQRIAAVMQAALEKLPERVQAIILKRQEGETFEAIGADLGISRERVRQLQRRGLRKLSEDYPVRSLARELDLDVPERRPWYA